MSDIGLLMTGILSPEVSTYNRPKISRNSISGIHISMKNQLHQVNNGAQIVPPEFSDTEKPPIPVNTRLSLAKEETFKRLAKKLYSNLSPILAEYKQSPKSNQDSFSTCTQIAEDEVNAREDRQQQLPLCSGNTMLQAMKVSATNHCNIQNRVNNQILIATVPNLTPSLNAQSLPTLRFGNSGIPVKLLQRVLLSNGYTVPTDGFFGALTETAVKAFQSQRDLSEDGVVGGNTWRELTIY